MKKMINRTHVEGLLYEHKLAEKTSGANAKNPGTVFINGSIDLATDDDCLNIVSVYFTYVTEKNAKGGTNATYTVLKSIIDGTYKTVMGSSIGEAVKIRIDSAIGLNEFYDKQGVLVTVDRNEGGFAHNVDKLNADAGARATFEVDMLITNVVRKDADPDNDVPEKVVVRGAIFDFRNALLPVEFCVLNEKGMAYFEDLGATSSSPVFTKVWGKQVSQTIKTTKVEESAFDEPKVTITERKKRDFVITGTSVEPYAWDSDETITAAELKKCMEDREIKLADIKKQQEEYQAKNNTGAAASTTPGTPAKGNYNF